MLYMYMGIRTTFEKAADGWPHIMANAFSSMWLRCRLSVRQLTMFNHVTSLPYLINSWSRQLMIKHDGMSTVKVNFKTRYLCIGNAHKCNRDIRFLYSNTPYRKLVIFLWWYSGKYDFPVIMHASCRFLWLIGCWQNNFWFVKLAEKNRWPGSKIIIR